VDSWSRASDAAAADCSLASACVPASRRQRIGKTGLDIGKSQSTAAAHNRR
jgi:hypothetical protein